MIDQTLNTLGQTYFNGEYILVGSQSYANKITDGVNDQIEIQNAIEEAFVSSGKKAVKIISNVSLQSNPLYTEVIGGRQRRLACRLRDNVSVIISEGVTVSFPSGGDAGGTFTSAFGNFGDLSNAQVICESNNIFDGLSTIAGNISTREHAISVDCRSNACTTLKGNKFIVSGKRCAGSLVKAYNSNGAGVSIAKHNNLTVLNADTCFSAGNIERNGEYWNIKVANVTNSLGNGLEIKDGLENSKLQVDSITNSNLNGLKVWIDTTVSLKFNEVDIEIMSIESSGEHNIFVQGLNGNISGQVHGAQKGGIFFEDVILGITSYYSTNIVLSNIISRNNNRSGSTFSGIGGIARNVQIIGSDTSDDQIVATQYRGIDFTNGKCDYINITGAQAKGNVNAQISITGVNSVVDNNVQSISNQRTIAAFTTYTISSFEDTYLLNTSSILVLPRFTDIDSTLPRKYTISCLTGTSTVSARQEIDSSYKQIGTLAAGVNLVLSAGQFVTIIKTATRWEVLGSTSLVQSIGVLTSDVLTIIDTTNTFYTISFSGADFAKTLPLASTVVGKTFSIQKITHDLSIGTFNTQGADRIQVYGSSLSPTVVSSCAIALPRELLRLTATASGFYRASYIRDLSFMDTILYRATTSQPVLSAAIATIVLTSYRDNIKTLRSASGFSAAANSFIAPLDGDYTCEVLIGVSTLNANTNAGDIVIDRALSATPLVWEAISYTSLARPTSVTDDAAQITRTLRLKKGDAIRLTYRNFGSSTANIVSSPVSADLPPQRSYMAIRLTNPLY